MGTNVYDKEDQETEEGFYHKALQGDDADLDDRVENGASATDEDLPPSHPSRSSALPDSDIAESEDNPDGSTITPDEDEIGGLYTGDDGKKKVNGKAKRNQKIAGGFAALLIAATFGTFTFMSGPLKVLHFGQLLKSFHLTNQEETGNDRMSKLYKFIRNRNSPERSRLNFIGNTYADKIESRMNKSGIKSTYNKRGYGNGYEIDYTKLPPESTLNDVIGDKTPGELQQAMADYAGVTPEKVKVNLDTGIIEIDSSDLGYFKSRTLVKNMMLDSGLEGIGASMRTRIMGKRAGITWHPIKNIDKKVLDTVDKRLASWRKDRTNRMDNGDTETKSTKKTGTDEDGNPTEPTDDANATEADINETNAQSQATAAEIESGTTSPDGALATQESALRGKLLGGAGAVSAIVGVLCAVKGLANNFDEIKYAQIVLPMMRIGMEAITVSDQIASGQIPDLEQVGYYAKLMDQVEKTYGTGKDKVTVPASSAFSARSIQAESGEELTGQDIPPEGKLGDGENFITSFMNQIPGLDTVCNAASSIIGTVVTTAIDIAGGPASAIVGQLSSRFIIGPALSALVRWRAGHPINVNVAGADYGNYANYGARLAANDSMISGGGRVMSGSEKVELKQHRIAVEKERMAEKSFAGRMFDIKDSGSLIAKVVDRTPGSVTDSASTMARISANFMSLLTSPLKLFSTLFGARVSAATDYDYGFPEFGFSVGELNNPAFQNPYENGDRALDILSGPGGGDYISRAEKCLGIKVSADGKEVKSVDKAPNYTNVAKDSSCSDTSDEWTSIRFYIFDTQIMTSQACFEGDAQSCTDTGFTGTADTNEGATGTPTDVGDKRQDTSAMACATTGLTGEQVVPVGDGSIKIKLCDYGEVRGVNASWSNNMSQLLAAAKADGKELAGGGFRTAAEQIRLRSVNHCADIYTASPDTCKPKTAIPGTSNHELGLAIDFKDMCYPNGTTCPGNDRYEWLAANASKWKVKQLRAEAWHWSVDGG